MIGIGGQLAISWQTESRIWLERPPLEVEEWFSEIDKFKSALPDLAKFLCSNDPMNANRLKDALIITALAAGFSEDDPESAFRSLILSTKTPQATVPGLDMQFSGIVLSYMIAALAVLLAAWNASQLRVLAWVKNFDGKEPWILIDPILIGGRSIFQRARRFVEFMFGVAFHLVPVMTPVVFSFLAWSTAFLFVGQWDPRLTSSLPPLQTIEIIWVFLGCFLLTASLLLAIFQIVSIIIIIKAAWSGPSPHVATAESRTLAA